MNMSSVILVSLLFGVPILLNVVLRVRPTHLFISIVTGYFLATYFGDSAELAFGAFVHLANPGVIIRIALLLLPVVFTWVFMRRTLPASALPIQFILLVADGVLLVSLLLPLMTSGMQNSIYNTNVGNNLRRASDVVIPSVAGLHCLFMWIGRPRHHEKHGHMHSKKHHKRL